VSLIKCTGGAYRPFLHDRHFSAALFRVMNRYVGNLPNGE
jgi:hypothetical protein